MNIEYQDGSKIEFFKELYEEAKSELEPLFNKLDQHIKQYK